MNKEECYYLGYISKTRGVRGELVAFLDVDSPGRYRNLSSFYLEINSELIPFEASNTRIDKKTFVCFGLEDYTTPEQAQELVGKQIYLPLTALPKLSGNKFYYHEIADFMVVDRVHGNLGKVIQVLDYPGNPLLEASYQGKEILVPINDKVIKKVDRGSKTIEVATPDGLLELYLSL